MGVFALVALTLAATAVAATTGWSIVSEPTPSRGDERWLVVLRPTEPTDDHAVEGRGLSTAASCDGVVATTQSS